MFLQSPSRVTELDEEPKPEPPSGQKPAFQPPSGKLLTNSPSGETSLINPNNAPNESGYRQKVLFPGTTKEWRVRKYYPTYTRPFISVTLTFHCIAIFIGAGAYDDGCDEVSYDDDMFLSDYIRQESMESTAALFPDIAKALEQFNIDYQNKYVASWLSQVE